MRTMLQGTRLINSITLDLRSSTNAPGSGRVDMQYDANYPISGLGMD